MGYSQHSWLKEYAVNGKVQSITTTRYSIIEQEGKYWVPADTSQWFARYTIHFNKEGNIDSAVYHYDYSRHKSPSSTVVKARHIYYYNNQHLLDSSVYINTSDQPFIRAYYKYKWISDKEYEVVSFDAENGLRATIEKNKLGDTYNPVSSEQITYSDNDSIISHSINSFERNSQSLIIKRLEKDILNKKTEVFTHEYFYFDKENNPVLSIVFKEGEKIPESIGIRFFQYYSTQ
jgi:hypothetical protein